MLTTFIAELKARNVRKTMTIYFSSALTTIGVIKLLIEVYNSKLLERLFPVAVTLLLFGLVSAFIFAWFHGKEGKQKIQKREIVFHLHVIIIGAYISFQVASDPARDIPLKPLGRSIAVLPFKNMGDNKEDEYFSDGITEDILTQLSKIGDLHVISRTSVMKYKNSEKTIPEIADELGVASILEGSVRRQGNRVRIVGQLINAGSDVHVWAETYDREMKDIFTIQTEVATIIAQELKAKLSPKEEKLLQKQPTHSLDAYDYYLNGRNYYYRLTKDANEQAIILFKKAIALDSSYALAYAGLADAYAQRFQRYGFGENWADSSIMLSLRAVALDQNIAEPYKSLGLAYYQKEWYQRAMTQYRKALELNPNYASVYANMGELLDWTGHQDEAVPLILKSIRLQPGRAGDFMKLGSVYFSLGMLERSAEMFKKAIELNPSAAAEVNLAEIDQVKGDFSAARKQLDTILALNPEDPHALIIAGNVELYDRKYEKAYVYYKKLHELSPSQGGLTTVLGFVLQKIGRKKEGDAMLDKGIATNLQQIAAGSEEGSRRYELARAYAIRHDIPQALRWFRDGIERGSGIGGYIDNDPLIESLRDNAEFQKMMTGLRARIAEMRTRVQTMERILLTNE